MITYYLRDNNLNKIKEIYYVKSVITKIRCKREIFMNTNNKYTNTLSEISLHCPSDNNIST